MQLLNCHTSACQYSLPPANAGHMPPYRRMLGDFCPPIWSLPWLALYARQCSGCSAVHMIVLLTAKSATRYNAVCLTRLGHSRFTQPDGWQLVVDCAYYTTMLCSARAGPACRLQNGLPTALVSLANDHLVDWDGWSPYHCCCQVSCVVSVLVCALRQCKSASEPCQVAFQLSAMSVIINSPGGSTALLCTGLVTIPHRV
jgi:hypothetical protein